MRQAAKAFITPQYCMYYCQVVHNDAGKNCVRMLCQKPKNCTYEKEIDQFYTQKKMEAVTNVQLRVVHKSP